MIPGTESKSYAELLQAYQPRPIESEEDARRVEEVIDELLDILEPTKAELELRTLFAALLALWEEGRYELPEVTPLERVHALIEDNGLRQKDLVPTVFPTEGIASEVLRGKRKLTYDFVARLASFFNVSPALFYPSPQEQALHKLDVPSVSEKQVGSPTGVPTH